MGVLYTHPPPPKKPKPKPKPKPKKPKLHARALPKKIKNEDKFIFFNWIGRKLLRAHCLAGAVRAP
jgi:hypothetical protein